jgi:hypothetical protein
VAPLQQNHPNAPAYVITPRVSISETLTDNVCAFASDCGRLYQYPAGLSFSADSPRFQGVA